MDEVDLYIEQFEGEVKNKLVLIRNIIKELAPNATERICLKMPTYDLNGKWLIHFAGFNKHIGFYPQPEDIITFSDKLKDYKTSKGTIQFPLNKSLPLELIREIVVYRVNEQSK